MPELFKLLNQIQRATPQQICDYLHHLIKLLGYHQVNDKLITTITKQIPAQHMKIVCEPPASLTNLEFSAGSTRFSCF